jgi:Rps23 Pro-64 3,4-dihydroxylase Tpa1-like proline 4-hydroxylase
MFGRTSKTKNIYVVDDCIDYANQEALLGFCNQSLYSFGHSASSTSSLDLSRFVSQLTPSELASTSLDAVFTQLVQQHYKRTLRIDRSYINVYFPYTPTALHTDDYDAEAITCMIYANPQWQADWAGETQFFNADLRSVQQSVLPQGGRTVLFDSRIPHAARTPSVICPVPRFTLTVKGFLV